MSKINFSKLLFLIKICFYSLPPIGLILILWVLPIKSVSCVDISNQQCDETTIGKLSQLIDQNLLQTAIRSDVIADLVAPNYSVDSYQIVWPNQMQLQLKPVQLAYLLNYENKILGVSEEGSLISAPSNQNLIQVTMLNSDITNGHVIGVVHSDVVNFIALLNQAGIESSQINWSNNHSSSLLLKSGQTVIFDEQNYKIDLGRLNQILSDPNASEKLLQYSTIDIRFRLPVLRK